LTADAFIHLPNLRERVTKPEQSLLRLTPEMFAMWEQRAQAAGWPASWRLPDDVIEAPRLALLGDHGSGDDLWIYSYGSLMWDPGFHFAEVRLADVENYQRRFTLKSIGGRGTPERPCLFLTLEKRAGICAGLAFRIPAHVADHESAMLWRREMLRGSYVPELSQVRTPQGDIQALVFASNPTSAHYFPEKPLAETAAIIAAASGPLGTNREYLEQVAAQLQVLQIEDDYISDLLRHVQRSDVDRSGA